MEPMPLKISCIGKWVRKYYIATSENAQQNRAVGRQNREQKYMKQNNNDIEIKNQNGRCKSSYINTIKGEWIK